MFEQGVCACVAGEVSDSGIVSHPPASPVPAPASGEELRPGVEGWSV